MKIHRIRQQAMSQGEAVATKSIASNGRTVGLGKDVGQFLRKFGLIHASMILLMFKEFVNIVMIVLNDYIFE
jgi:hypothetical protein